MTAIELAVRQLKQSERGRATCALLHRLFESDTINGLDSGNRNAVMLLVYQYLCEQRSGSVIAALREARSAGPMLKALATMQS